MKIDNNIAIQRPSAVSPARGIEKPDSPVKSVQSNRSIESEADQQSKTGKEELKKKVESMNKFIEPSNTALKFQFHEKLNEYYVSIVDSNTKKVVREIPPKKFLDMYAHMLESIGLLVDHKI